jgi:hypothetical protein
MAFHAPVPLLSRRARILTGLLFALAAGAALAGQAGELAAARGVVTAQSAQGAARIVGSGSPIHEGDVVTTGPRSLAVLKLLDGTRITLRPESSFQVERFNAAENQESAVFTLFKGGLRAVTGFISKRNPQAMRLRTSVATIGIRGTEFDARLCGADCQAEAKQRPAPAGRAGFVKGNVLARAPSGRGRNVAAGGAVYNGDTLLTSADGYAVIVFRDQSRVTLLPGTEFRVDKLAFDAADPDRGEGVFSLVRGGLRAVSGLIGRNRGRGYQMRTAVATIGIRGTGYDAVCQGNCMNPAPDAGPDGDGLFAEVWDGTIVLDEVTEVGAGKTVFLGNPGDTPVEVPDLPITIDEPRPNDVEVSEQPPAESSTNPDDGLYVSCYAGNCAVETPENTVELEPGEAGFVGTDGGPAEQLDEVPPFQAEDPVLQAVEVGDAAGRLLETLDTGVRECTVQ